MKTGIFGVYDVRAEMYGTPFFMKNDGLARRAFEDLVQDAQSTVSRHPGDFKLVALGWFDDETGEVQSLVAAGEQARTLGFGSDFVRSPRVNGSPLMVDFAAAAAASRKEE